MVLARVARRALRVAPLLAGLGLAWIACRAADFARVPEVLRGAGPALLLVLLPFPLSMAVETLAWRKILGSLGARTGFWSLLGIRISAEAVLSSTPSGTVVADTVKPVLLKRVCGVPYPAAVASIAAKRFFLILSHGLYMATGALLAREALGRASARLFGRSGLEWLGPIAALVLLAVAGAMSLIFAHGSPATRLRQLVSRAPLRPVRRWLSARAERIRDTDACLVHLFRRPHGWAALPASLFWVGWAWESVETYLILRALHVPLPFVEVLSFETLLTLARSLAVFAPSGLGVQDAGYVTALACFGVPDAATVGVTFVLVKRLKELFWIVLGFGMLTLFTSRPRQDAAAERPLTPAVPAPTGASLPVGEGLVSGAS